MADRSTSSEPEDELAAIAERTTGHLATPEDLAVFQDRLMRLLERRTMLYTMGDSTSVPKHVAANLLLSICFVLGIDSTRPEIPERLLRVDLDDEFQRRLANIAREVELTGELWRAVNAAMPALPNIALQDTLASIGNFPRDYDFRSMAHEIPASIDYPLCHPVPEDLLGVDYINEYLRRLLIEAEFLRCFERVACERVLSSASPDYVGLLVNLYEPVATNAIGRALLGTDPRPLRITDEERAEIAGLLGPLGEGARGKRLRVAATEACRALGIEDAAAVDYLRALVPELLPRIAVGIERGDLRGLFVG